MTPRGSMLQTDTISFVRNEKERNTHQAQNRNSWLGLTPVLQPKKRRSPALYETSVYRASYSRATAPVHFPLAQTVQADERIPSQSERA